MSDTPEGPLTVKQAAQAFGSVFAPTGETQDAPEPIESEAPAEDVVEEDTSSEFSEDSEADPDSEGTEEEEDSGDAEPGQSYTVRINGEDVEVSLDELLTGYSRTQDYTRKTMALADQRKSLESELTQIRQERAQLAQVLSQIDVQDKEQEPNWDQLYQQDPIEWVRQRELWREKQERKRALVEERQRLLQAQESDKQRIISEFVGQEAQRLVEVIPAWRDEKVAKAEKAKVADYARSIGFTDQEIGQFYDSRAVAALYKAMKFDELQSGKPKAQRKVAPTAKAGTAASQPKQRDAYRKAQQRLAKSGNVRDAADAFKHLLG